MSSRKEFKEEKPILTDDSSGKPICGIVMPISPIDGCTESHWKEVQSIISDAVVDAGFEPNLVSNDADVGVIHKRIVQNLYKNPIVVCDVSAKNPNVMFELGMRLAFDKPVIIIKDDKTPYSFDTAPVEHLTYPRDLRFTAILEFKKNLTKKIVASLDSENSFLASFGTFKVAKLKEEQGDAFDLIVEEIAGLKSELRLHQARILHDRSRIIERMSGDVRPIRDPRRPEVTRLLLWLYGKEEELISIIGFLSEASEVRVVSKRSAGDDSVRYILDVVAERVDWFANELKKFGVRYQIDTAI